MSREGPQGLSLGFAVEIKKRKKEEWQNRKEITTRFWA